MYLKQQLSVAAVLFAVIGIAAGCNLRPNAETIALNEDKQWNDLANFFVTIMNAQNNTLGNTIYRGQHAKTTGCVHATFEVADSLPQEFRIGIFANNKYPAFVRFSPGAGNMSSDFAPGPKGMSIKLFNVPGKKLEKDDANAQDLLFITDDTFIAASAQTYENLINGFAEPSTILSKVISGDVPIRSLWSTAKTLFKNRFPVNPLTQPYYSAVPFAFGTENTVKYIAKPCNDAPEWCDKDGYDCMRELMIETLAKRDVCYHFYLQFQTDACAMPIEDSTVSWGDMGQIVHAATLRIPMQEFDFQEQFQYCEELSFDPWHSLEAHKPLGAANRARRIVYQKTSDIRRELNRIAEPNMKKFNFANLPPQFSGRKYYSSQDIYQHAHYPQPLYLPSLVKNLPVNEQFDEYLWKKIDVAYKVSQFEAIKQIRKGLNAADLVEFDNLQKLQEDLENFEFKNISQWATVFGIKDQGKPIIQTVMNNWDKDEFFGSQFIRGVNPMSIHRLTDVKTLDELGINYKNYPKQFKNVLGGKSLEAEIEESNLYYADYSLFKGIPTAGERTAYPGFCLFRFERNSKKLLPIAIQLERELQLENNRIFFPPGNSQLNPYIQENVWKLAKMFIASADSNKHEMLSHLLYTHLTLEAIIVATHRNFKEDDTIRRVLLPHFKGTLAINTWGREQLLQPGGVFDLVSPFAMVGTLGFMSKAFESYNFTQMSFPRDMERRGFKKVEPNSPEDVLPGFLYRDYGYLIWDMIVDYTIPIIDKKYQNDEQVKNDLDLQEWALEISDPEYGNVRGFPSSITTKAQLVEIIANLIFTSSAQHSAVNNGQFDYSSYVPNRPFALRKWMPHELDSVTDSFVIEALPNVRETCFLVSTVYVLSTPPDEYVSANLQASVSLAMNMFGREWVDFYTDNLKTVYDTALRAQNLMETRNKNEGYYYPYLYPFAMSLSIQV